MEKRAEYIHLRDTVDSVQIGGDHYKDCEIQPWDAMESWLTKDEFEGYLKGNIIKYIARERKKGGTQDVLKASHYIDKLIQLRLVENEN